MKFAGFVYFLYYAQKRLSTLQHCSKSFPLVIEKYTKFANFTGLYLPHIRNQIGEPSILPYCSLSTTAKKTLLSHLVRSKRLRSNTRNEDFIRFQNTSKFVEKYSASSPTPHGVWKSEKVLLLVYEILFERKIKITN